MIYPQTTQVPNILFDTYLSSFTESELKVILVVIRQTLGWKDMRTGNRKVRDRISGSQFREKTGLSKRVITNAIAKLSERGLLEITDYNGAKLSHSLDRKGKTYLFYCVKNPVHLTTSTSAQSVPSPVHNCYHNKTKRKEAGQKDARSFVGHIGTLIAQKDLYNTRLTPEVQGI